MFGAPSDLELLIVQSHDETRARILCPKQRYRCMQVPWTMKGPRGKVMSNCSQIRSPNLLIKLQVLKVHEFLKWSPGLNNVKIRFNFVKYHRKIYRSSIISFSLLTWWVVGLHFLASITPRTFIYGKMVYNFTLSTTTNGFPTFNANKARFKVLSPIVISSW